MMQCLIEIPADHPSFAGHFPNFPLLPGALLLNETLSAIERDRGIDLAQWQIASAKFLAVVRPNDQLLLQHELSSPGLIHFTIRVANRKVASGSLANQQRGDR